MEIILEWDLGESGFPSSSRCAQAAHIFYHQSMHDKEKREVIFSWKSWGGWVWLEPDPMSLICIRCPPLPTKEDARVHTCLGLENNCGNIKLPRGQTPRIQIDFRYIQIDSACENVSRSNSMIVSFPKYCLAYIYTTEPPKPQIHLNRLIPIA